MYLQYEKGSLKQKRVSYFFPDATLLSSSEVPARVCTVYFLVSLWDIVCGEGSFATELLLPKDTKALDNISSVKVKEFKTEKKKQWQFTKAQYKVLTRVPDKHLA